jgi:hypothetical protein
MAVQAASSALLKMAMAVRVFYPLLLYQRQIHDPIHGWILSALLVKAYLDLLATEVIEQNQGWLRIVAVLSNLGGVKCLLEGRCRPLAQP